MRPQPSAWRRWLVAAALATASAATVSTAYGVEEPVEEQGPFFGAGNIPSLCEPEMVDALEDGTLNPDFWLRNTETPVCHHMRTGLNGLDSPQVDVLVLVPVSPAAERDARITRQAVEMWDGGIDHVAEQLEMDWLAQGVDFDITVDHVDVDGEGGGEFTTYPVVDPEIVVVVSNPVGGVGIGIDPLDFTDQIEDIMFGAADVGEGPCHGVKNPFDLALWEALPGFDSHHEAREGVYNEDCGGAGGNICFAVNGGVDPTPGDDVTGLDFALFDLVAHEVGHCLSVGHVGDGAEGDWGGLPSNDIMAYSSDPVDLHKCVSSLDVEGFALRMSRFLDRDGDGAVTEADELEANDQVGDGMNAFQVQRPQDHFYASSTGSPTDCPQPDLALLPGGERTDWTPGSGDEPAEQPTAGPKGKKDKG